MRKKAVNCVFKAHRTACKPRVQFQESEEDLQEQIERLKLYWDNQPDTIAKLVTHFQNHLREALKMSAQKINLSV